MSGAVVAAAAEVRPSKHDDPCDDPSFSWYTITTCVPCKQWGKIEMKLRGAPECVPCNQGVNRDEATYSSA